MKKLLAIICCTVLVTGLFSFTACNDGKNDGSDGESSKMPAIPAGVVLSDVPDDEMTDTVNEFITKYKEADNAYFDCYVLKYDNTERSYTYEGKDVAGGSQYKREQLINSKMLKTTDKTFYDAVASKNSYEMSSFSNRFHEDDGNYDTDNLLTECPITLKARDDIFTATYNDYKVQNNDNTFNTTGLFCYVKDDKIKEDPEYGNNAISLGFNLAIPLSSFFFELGDYNLYKYCVENNFEYFHESAHEEDPYPTAAYAYNVEVKADDTKLYINLERTIDYTDTEDSNNYSYEYEQRFVHTLYLDTAATLTENNFDEGKIDESDIGNILYFEAPDNFKTDFTANKEIVINALGGGDGQYLKLSYTPYIDYKYDGNDYRFDYDNITVADGKLTVAANTYSEFISEISEKFESFDISELSDCKIHISTQYSTDDESVDNGQMFNCYSYLFISL